MFDIIHPITDNGRWDEISYYMILVGVIGGLISAVPGTIDWLAMPNRTRAKGIGSCRSIGNVVVVVLFAGGWLLRRANVEESGTMAVGLSFAGVLLALPTGWLGWELVDRGAHLNSPRSLSNHPASDNANGGTSGSSRRGRA